MVDRIIFLFWIFETDWIIVRAEGLRDTGQEERYLGEIFSRRLVAIFETVEGEKRFFERFVTTSFVATPNWREIREKSRE